MNSDDPGDLHVYNTTSSSGYSGDYSGIDLFQENFTGIATPWTVREAMTGTDHNDWGPSIRKEVHQLKYDRKAWGKPVSPEEARGKYVVKTKFAFKIKLDKFGKPIKKKSRMVAQGFTQREGENFDNTFAPVVRIDTFRMFCAQAARTNCKLHGMDFEGAYLQSDLDCDIYFTFHDDLYTYADQIGLTSDDIGKKGDIFKLDKSLYGLKQAGALWHELLSKDLQDIGFHKCSSDECLYTINTPDGFRARLITYVDDVMYLSNDEERMEALIDQLADPNGKARVFTKDDADWFIGIRIDQDLEKGTIKLSQTAFIEALLENNKMNFNGTACKAVDAPCSNSKDINADACPNTPVDAELKERQSGYRSVVGAVLYLWKCCRPDITFAINRLGRYASNPGEAHFKEMTHLLKYLKGTKDLGLTYHRDYSPDFHVSSTAMKGKKKFDLLRPLAYADADWAADQSNRRSCSGYCITWMGAAVLYGCSVQQCVALSTTEAEIIALSRATQEVVSARKVMADLDVPDRDPAFLFCDNRGAIALTRNNRFHKRTKHIDLRYFYCRDKEKDSTIRTAKVPTAHNLADGMTKGLSKNTVIAHRLGLHGMSSNIVG